MARGEAVISIFFLLYVFSNAHNILTAYRFICGPNGAPDSIRVQLYNDWDWYVDLNTSSAALSAFGKTSSGFPAGFPSTIRLGHPPGCDPCTNTGNTNRPPFGTVDSWSPPSEYYFTMPLVPNPTYASCKAANPTATNCGNVFQDIVLQGWAKWHDGVSMSSPPPTGLWTSRGDEYKDARGNTVATYKWSFPESTVATAACPSEAFDCPDPPVTRCKVGPCPDDCNSFELLSETTVGANTLVKFNVTNNCAYSFYHAAFGLDGGIDLVSPTAGSTYSSNYQWNIVRFDGRTGASQTTPAIIWLRFVSPNVIGNAQFTNTTGKGPAWEVFEFTVSGYTPAHLWTVQAHEGARYETFPLDVSLCTTTDNCPPGFAGANCDKCDVSPPPSGYDWYCRPTGNPSNPWQLVKVPLSQIGVAPNVGGFVPHNSTGDQVRDSDGYLIECDCDRVIYDCQPVSYCSGHGACTAQTGECVCDAGYLPPNCQPPPPDTTPASTTPSSTDTTATQSTQPGETTPDTTTTLPATTNPSCYNNGKFCTGHGTCVGTQCDCQTGFTGAACDAVVQDNAHYCDEFSDCTSCISDSSTVGLNCSWCGDIAGGGCTRTDLCTNVRSTCGSGGMVFVPESCPDDCSGSSHGVCVDTSCQTFRDAKKAIPMVNGHAACVETGQPYIDPVTNATVEPPQADTSYCLCNKGYSGNNCGKKSSALGKALAISGGVIAAVVICGVIVILIVAFGAKKGVDWVSLNRQAKADFKNNPLEQKRGGTYDNPIMEH